MKKLILLLMSVSLSSGMAMAQDQDSDSEKSDKPSPAARIASYGKVGRVVVDGQTIYVSKGLTDIIMEEGQANLDDDARIQCRRVRRTGSHISMRICRTQAEIKEQSDFNKEYFERWYLRQRRSICAEGGTTRGQRIQGTAINC